MEGIRKTRPGLAIGFIYKLSKDFLSIFLLALVLLNFGSGAWAGGPSVPPSTGKPSPTKFSSDRVIVKFKKEFLPALKNLKAGIPTLASEILKKNLAQAGVKLSKHFDSLGISVVELPDKGKSIKEIIGNLQKSGMVEYAEPDYEVKANLIPDDPKFGDLWGMHNTGLNGGANDADIDAPEAWDIQTGNVNDILVVIDTGVDYNHEDLAGNMWINTNETLNGNDDDGNGYIDDIHGIDTINNDGDPMDDNDHGTHVSGTIGAVGNNGIGVVGVNHDVQIMGCKFLGANGSGSSSDAIECLNYAVNMKVNHGWPIKLTNNSWGGGGFSQGLYDAIEATGNNGMLFIAAAGNNGSNTDGSPHYPSSYNLDNILSVAATDRNDGLAGFSNYGATTVDLGAPGVDINSTLPGNSYSGSTWSGTSMATPHVAGAVGLIWQQFPSFTHSEVKTLILATVDPLPSLDGKTVTGGRLNVNNAVFCTPNSPTLLIQSPGAGFAVEFNQSATVAVLLHDCGMPLTGATVIVTPTNGDGAFNLFDDGNDPDQTAGDGIYSSGWFPASIGPVTLDIDATIGSVFMDSVSGEVFLNYVFDDQVAFNWIDAAAGTNISLTDDASKLIPIGFDFQFYGNTYSSVNISSNGFLFFTGSGGTAYVNETVPSNSTPNNLIAPFWDDLNPNSGGQVRYLLQGTAPNKRLTIEWMGLPHYSNTGAVTFEATLFENSNEIKFQYLDVDFNTASYDFGASASVGVENQEGAIGAQYSYNTPSLSNGSAILVYLPNSSDHSLAITIGPNGNPDPVVSGTEVNLNVTAVDSQGHPMNYEWWSNCSPWSTLDPGSFSNSYARNPTWIAPSNTSGITQECTISVDVNDGGEGLSDSGFYYQAVDPEPGMLSVSPDSDFSASGPKGGPFPDTITYTLMNTGGTAFTYNVSKTKNWISLSRTNGTLAPNQSHDVTVSINSRANRLKVGSYSDTIFFTNTNTGAGDTTHVVSLSVVTGGGEEPPPPDSGGLSVSPTKDFKSSGKQGGSFKPSSKDYTLTNTGNGPIDYAVTHSETETWLIVSPSSGTIPSGGSVIVSATITSGANSLSPGNYNDVVTFTNTTNGVGDTTRSVSLRVR